jgi:uncharacterized protein YndB with AHSA1/START domain
MNRDGTVEIHDDYTILRYERRLQHPIERVWAAITEPDEIEAWFARAQVDLLEGGAMQLDWLNTDENGNSASMPATITALEPRRLLEIEGDPHGVVRFELRPDGDATILTLIARTPVPDDVMRLRVSAGWHVHLDFLEEFLDDGTRVDWPNWPLDRWEALYERYASGVLANDAQSSRQAAER